MVKILLEHQANPRAKNNSRGQIPLHLAVSSGDQRVVQLLLEAAPDTVNYG